MAEGKTRTARCACGALEVRVEGEPFEVHMCSCRDCQRSSGSAFTYTAFFAPEMRITVSGEYRTWRRLAETGRYDDSCFCPNCGATVFGWVEGYPGVTKIAVGCFNEPDFPAPTKLCWSSRKAAWLAMPAGIEELATQ